MRKLNALLDRAECLGTGSIACKDDEIAALLVQEIDCLEGVFVNDIKRACSVGCTRIVAQIEVIVLGKMLANFVENGQSAVAAIKNTNQSSFQFTVDN